MERGSFGVNWRRPIVTNGDASTRCSQITLGRTCLKRKRHTIQLSEWSYTDQDDVGEVDDEDGGGDEQLAVREDVFFEDDRQSECDGPTKSSVRHHELADAVQLGRTHQVRQAIQDHHH